MTSDLGGVAARRVVFVCNALANGGAERVLCLLANRAAARGHEVLVLAYTARPDEYELAPEVQKRYAPQGAGWLGKLRRLRWIRSVLREDPTGVVVAFEYFVNLQTLLASMGLSNRVIVSERNDPARVGNKFPVGMVRRVLYPRADVVVCQTDDAAAYFSPRVATRVIHNPVNPHLPPVHTGTRRRCVVTFGRLEAQKNLGLLVHAFARFHQGHPDYELEIYGQGSQRAELLALIEALALGGVAHVLPPTDVIHSLVADASMFAISSDYEGLSNSMIEAMALGLPTISTDSPCGGARTLITSGVNGLLVPVRDVDALAMAMSHIADDESFALRMGQEATRVRDRLSIESIGSEWDALVRGGAPS